MSKTLKSVETLDLTKAETFTATLTSIATAFGQNSSDRAAVTDQAARLAFEGVVNKHIVAKPSKQDREAGRISVSDYAAKFLTGEFHDDGEGNLVPSHVSRGVVEMWIRLGGAQAAGLDTGSAEYKALKVSKRAKQADMARLATGKMTVKQIGDALKRKQASKPASPRKRSGSANVQTVRAVSDSLTAAAKRWQQLTVKQRESIDAAISTYQADVAAQAETDVEPETATA